MDSRSSVELEEVVEVVLLREETIGSAKKSSTGSEGNSPKGGSSVSSHSEDMKLSGAVGVEGERREVVVVVAWFEALLWICGCFSEEGAVEEGRAFCCCCCI